MIDQEFAAHFAADWIAAWNSHDLERILVHYRVRVAIEAPADFAVVREALSSCDHWD